MKKILKKMKCFKYRVEVFDADKLGKDKSLGLVEINPRDFDSKEPKWFPLQASLCFYTLFWLKKIIMINANEAKKLIIAILSIYREHIFNAISFRE